MTLFDLMKGKTVRVETNIRGVVADLVIESVAQNNHSQDLEPATAANDWWPNQKTWTTYNVKFTNGFEKAYNSISEINMIEPVSANNAPTE